MDKKEDPILSIGLPLTQWNFILEVIQMVDKPIVRGMAIELLKKPLDEQYNQHTKSVSVQ